MSKFSIAMLVWAVLSFFSPSDEGEQVPAEATFENEFVLPPDTTELSPPLTPPNDTGKVKKNPNNRVGDPTRQGYVSPLQMGNPASFETKFELADDLSGFNIFEKSGGVDIRRPSFISYENYLDYSLEKSNKDYFRDQSLQAGGAAEEGLELNIDIEELSDIFGGGGITIRPTGFATLRFSLDRNITENPALDQRSQRLTNFNFDQNIQLGVTGQIGNAMRLNVNFDTKATFDFENELKLGHKGTEDQILQEIEAGNVSMQVGNSLIQGRQNLFGVKTKLKFGPVMVSGIASMERGKVESLNVSGGGAVETPFEREAVDYDANRHFFLSHFFRSRYNEALENLPIIQSTLRVNRVEVWVQQQGFSRVNRNAVGLVDLGENDNGIRGGQGQVYNPNLDQSTDQQYFYPDNQSNELYDRILKQTTGPMREQSTVRGELENLGLGLENTEDFEILGNMRKLQPNEYVVNSQLGYVSLNTPLRPDQVLFVAFDYTLDNQVHQVGEFSQDIPANNQTPNVLFLKMLKPSVLRVAPYPAWDLMMKNIYSVGYGMQPDGFFLDLQFESGTKAGKVNYLPNCELEGKPLIQILGLDRVTNNTAPGPDNYFDYIPGITVRADRGLVIFPTLEPFGDYLREQLGDDSTAIEKYVFDELYDRTQPDAERYAPQFRYSIEGYYRSSATNEIPLNTFNLQTGSVVVTAGGRRLIEGSDYRVDYFGGKIVITNPSILTSGQDIQVSYESSAMLQLQTKSLIGARAEYSPFKNVNVGATVLNLREQPLQQKTLLGEEPTANTLWGLDMNLNRESAFLTKAIDKLPLLSTKEVSNIQMSGEMAQFIPGVPGSISNATERGFVYIDDFEAATQPYPLMGAIRWQLAAYPEGNPDLLDPVIRYPNDSLAINYTRSKLAWFQIDRTLYSRYQQRIAQEDQENNYTRLINFQEIFPEETRPTGAEFQQTFDLLYLPKERGPYNYQTDPSTLDPASGDFRNPRDNWAGISRSIDINNDFEANNVEFIEFWLMDPFDPSDGNPNSQGGEMYINLGRISEEVIPDGFLTREHAIPPRADSGFPTDTSAWGIVGTSNPINNAFDSDPTARLKQDVGLDGLSSVEEAIFFNEELAELQGFLSPAAFAKIQNDPSSDDFVFYLDDQFPDQQVTILDRYANFSGLEANSPIGDSTTSDGLVKQNTTLPNNEDINNNGSLNIAERYYEYRIRLHPDSLDPGENFVVDRISSQVRINRGGDLKDVTWYQFRIPIREGQPVNDIDNFKTISFMRMYLTDWADTARLRFTEFQFVASQWIRFDDPLFETNTPPPTLDTRFELGQVSLNKNANRQPFNFVLPPGIELQPIYGNAQPGIFQDERSLAIQVEDLAPDDARGIFKVTRQDLRQYDRLKMFVHAEQLNNGGTSNFNQRGDATVFMRLGLDNDNNYYEYEIPLTPSELVTAAEYNEVVWPFANEFDIELGIFASAKSARDAQIQDITQRYAFVPDTLPEGHRVIVKGTPKLSDVRYIMIGVRNTRQDEEPISLELWVNELRTTNFDRRKGWAANLNTSVKLADVGTVTFSGAYKSSGFGPLEQKLSTRSLEDMMRYDVSANLSLQKFLPSHWGVNAPVYATYGVERVRPIFNPREADIRTDELIEALPRPQAREKIREIEDLRTTRSISLNNWRIDPKKKEEDLPSGASPGRPGAVPQQGRQKQDVKMPWHISNFDFTFSYSEKNARDAVTEKQYETQYRGAVNYRYQFPQVTLEPFWFTENEKFLGGKLGGLNQFSINPFPSDFSVSVDGNRRFEERIIRIFNQSTFCIDSLGHDNNDRSIFAKNFLLNRRYNLTWPLTPNLNVSFNADNMGRIDEVPGYWDETLDTVQQFIAQRGTFGEQLIKFGQDPSRGHYQSINFGRTIQYKHNINASYSLPTSYIPPLDWISGNINYTTTFDWMQAPEINPGLGGTISNTQNMQGTARVDLNSLYRKFKPLDKALSPKPPNPNKKKKKRNTKEEGDTPPPGLETQAAENDTLPPPNPFVIFMKNVGREVIRLSLSLRSVDLNYSRNGSTILPGYLPGTDNFGLDLGRINTEQTINSPIAPPTLGFIVGSQDTSVRNLAARYGWITQDTNLTNPFIQNYTENLTGRATVELFTDFRIELSINRNITQNYSEFFRWVPDSNNYEAFSPLETGSFSTSYIFLNTAFEKIDTANQNFSELFTQFSDARAIISARYAALNPETQGSGETAGQYANGYLGSNQDVLITSFLATYGIYDPQNIELNPRPRIPLPNWTINYSGLSKLPFLKEHFTSFNIRHGYRATYSVGNFNNNLNFTDFDGNGYADIPLVVDTAIIGVRPYELINYQSRLVIQTVQISEQFTPLVGVSFNTKNGVQGQFEYKRGRQLSLNVGSLQLIEVRNQDLSITMGFRKDKLNLFFRAFGKDINLDNSANFQFRLTMRDTREFARTLDPEGSLDKILNQTTRGAYNLVLNPAIDYVANKRLNVRLFYEQNLNRPYTSNTFNTNFWSVGFQLRFTLAN